MIKNLAQKQAEYYGILFKKFGPSIDAVASGLQIYKDLRYDKLSKVFLNDNSFSLHDVGFGLGHYYEYLKEKFPDKSIEYSGSEVTPQFVEYCRSTYPEASFFHRNLENAIFPEKYDYLVFGGTFYHLSGSTVPAFWNFVKNMLRNAYLSSNKGIAFNLITDFVEYQKAGLFYADLGAVIKFVVNDLSRFFMIDHALPLYEYTISVYNEKHIAKMYPDEAFQKYYKIKS